MGSVHLLLLFFCLTQLWGQICSNTTFESAPTELPTTATATTEAATATATTEAATATTEAATEAATATATTSEVASTAATPSVSVGVTTTGYPSTTATATPPNAEGFKATGQNETSITLQWNKVNDTVSYNLQYGGENEEVPGGDGAMITHTVSRLKSGTRYDFTLFTVFRNVSSTGVNATAVTAPSNAEGFKATGQNETSITLQWNKVNDTVSYNLQYGGENEEVPGGDGAMITHTVLQLKSGTRYDFTLFTVFGNVSSTGVNATAVTAPSNAEGFKATGQNETSITLQWNKVNDTVSYNLQYGGENEEVPGGDGAMITHTVMQLKSGTRYDFTLFTVFGNVSSTGVNATAVTAPPNAAGFRAAAANETSITLEWSKVEDILHYTLLFNYSEINVTALGDNVTYTVLGLTAGTKYPVFLFTVFKDIRSSGSNINAATAPLQVSQVNVTERSVTSITLQWNKVDQGSNYTLFLSNGETLEIPCGSPSDVLTYRVSPLRAGAEYNFTLVAVFYGVQSHGSTVFTVTAIDCANSNWHVTNSSIHGTIEGLFSEAKATAIDGGHDRIHHSKSTEGGNVAITGLVPGFTYKLSLVYIKNQTPYEQCVPQHHLTIVPPDLNVHCDYWGAGYGISLQWEALEGFWNRVEVNVSGRAAQTVEGITVSGTQLSGFQPAQKYQVSVASLSGGRRSNPFILVCTTDPRGVIAGSVVAVLLFGILVCLAVCIVRRKKIYAGTSKLSSDKHKSIPEWKFTDHFHQLSADQSRGFSEEYEDLLHVGTEQTHKAALIQENRSKNRFANVYPYDWSRVKLSTINHGRTSDYINANFMPGYGRNGQYIAAQGPLPNTVDDFWRMIWEQGAKAVVMVTNCTEGGRTKCEQYWPLDYTPRLYGDLLVTVKSEQKTHNWTMREFVVKNSETSVERSVKHFHFTAWPDHGVPVGTEALIHFRGLVRQHIESEGANTPTVVHCSAGVGRTGTIIALDVVLQQLERERAVGIAAFVHKMRLSRPLMVQTEIQYVFLHQCIMDSLKAIPKIEENLYENTENIYENTDMIYSNTTALQEFANTNV